MTPVYVDLEGLIDTDNRDLTQTVLSGTVQMVVDPISLFINALENAHPDLVGCVRDSLEAGLGNYLDDQESGAEHDPEMLIQFQEVLDHIDVLLGVKTGCKESGVLASEPHPNQEDRDDD